MSRGKGLRRSKIERQRAQTKRGFRYKRFNPLMISDHPRPDGTYEAELLTDPLDFLLGLIFSGMRFSITSTTRGRQEEPK
jgi:hypothetical protein